MKQFIFILSIIALTVSCTTQAQEKNISKRGTTAGSFLSIPQGARASGMGQAFSGIRGDLSGIYWNPASLATLPGINVSFDHTNWFANLKFNFAAVSVNVPSFGTLGLSVISSDIDEMAVTTLDEPDGTGEVFSVSYLSVSLAYALQLTDRFSIGFNPKFVNETLWKMHATGFAVDMGVQYITPFDDMVLAMSINNFGSKMQLLGTSSLVLHDQDLGSTGNNDKIPAYLETESWALPLTFRIGVAYQAIKQDDYKLLIAADALHPSDDYESINLGTEFTVYDLVSVRAGYKSLFMEDSEEGLTLGIGVLQRFMENANVRVDYSFAKFGRLKDVQKFSVSLAF
ncbi:MAG: PorV/PorQ family protein [Ignavibacteriales bacterium]|nr:PorV/PorQ family protein [Ignavibacteriales bacterium]